MSMGPAIERITGSAYTVPTESPESDGTLEWDYTTIVIAEAEAGGTSGLGYTYSHETVAKLVQTTLSKAVEGRDAFDVTGAWEAMVTAIRNLGRPGMCSMAIAAVDVALWDLKARLLGVPLVSLLGGIRDRVAIYGSGGFTSYSVDQLCEQLGGWAQSGIEMVKMKVGREPQQDVERVRAARASLGDNVELFVDANGAYERRQALAKTEAFAEAGVTWFEEPVSSDDLEGLRMLRDSAAGSMDIAAGEYGYDLFYFNRMLEAGAVDVLQADATRCAGITELMRVDALCRARSVPLSAHTAPALHLHPCCAAESVRHIEYFHDHVRIERILFDGVVEPDRGGLHPDMTRPGTGLELKRADAEPYAA
jgi:L-alanine-DL-glutamate epimerase-like enolase superfamily enzyme